MNLACSARGAFFFSSGQISTGDARDNNNLKMTKTNPKEAGIVEVVDKQAMDGAILDAVARSFMVLQCRSEQIVVIAIREEVVRVGNIDAVYVFNRTSHHPQIVHTGQQLP